MPIFHRENPFVKFLLPLVGGIILARFLSFSQGQSVVLLVSSFGFFILSNLVPLKYKYRYFLGLGAALFLLSLGVFVYVNKTDVDVHDVSRHSVFVKITDVPQQTKYGFKVVAKIEGVKDSVDWFTERQKALLYFNTDSDIGGLKAGSKLLINAKPQKPKSKGNPFEFDYATYLHNQGIYSIYYLNKNDWLPVKSSSYNIKQTALNLRAKLLTRYSEAGISNQQLAVLSALTLGYKAGLDPEIKKAYAGAGAMHVLAVSGLHVGIVYAILWMLLGILFIQKKFPRIAYALIILGLWAYAMLTGLSPSVTRAASMFTFVLIGRVLGKRISIYNSLAAAAFFMLLLNPLMLFNVGFQLSFIAVAGIVFLYPHISNWIYFKAKIPRLIWQAIAVSLAAQISTFPLGVYYFHQFPVYFWLSNLMVLLSAFALIYSGVILLLIYPITPLFSALGTFIDKLVKGVNEVVIGVSELPYAVLKPLYISEPGVWFLYAILFFVSLYFIKRKVSYLRVSLIAVLLLSANYSYSSIKVKFRKQIAIYNNKDIGALHLTSGKHAIWINSGNDSLDENSFQKNADAYYGIKHVDVHNVDDEILNNLLYYKNGFIAFDTLRAFVLSDANLKFAELSTPVSVDYLFVLREKSIDISKVLSVIDPRQIVVSARVPYWQINRWKNETDLPIYSVQRQGAFLTHLMK